MSLWSMFLLAVLVITSHILMGLVAGIVLAAKLTRWRFPVAVSHLHIGEHQCLVVKCLAEVDQEAQNRIGWAVRKVLKANGVNVPVITVGNRLDFSVIGDQVAESGQRRPA